MSKNRKKGAEYKRWRLKVLKQDNYTCQRCGRRKELQVHHIFTIAMERLTQMFKEDALCGITVCKTCHEYWHRLLKIYDHKTN